MARECRQAWSSVHPGKEVMLSNVPVDDATLYIVPPPEEAPSEASEESGDGQLMSGDEEVVASPAPPPPVSVPDGSSSF